MHSTHLGDIIGRLQVLVTDTAVRGAVHEFVERRVYDDCRKHSRQEVRDNHLLVLRSYNGGAVGFVGSTGR